MIQSAGKIAIGVLVAATIVVGGGFALSNSQANDGGSSTSSVVIITTNTITSTTTFSNSSTTNAVASSSSCATITGYGMPIYLKVTSDDGSPITNGSVLVAHYGPAVNGVSCVVKADQVPLKPLTNGYTMVSMNASLPLAGNYNLTLTVGYGGKTFTSQPPVAAGGPMTPVYITVVVPSGLLVYSDCINGSCQTTSMKTASGG